MLLDPPRAWRRCPKERPLRLPRSCSSLRMHKSRLDCRQGIFRELLPQVSKWDNLEFREFYLPPDDVRIAEFEASLPTRRHTRPRLPTVSLEIPRIVAPLAICLSSAFPKPRIPAHGHCLAGPDAREFGMFLVDQNIPLHMCYYGRHHEYRRAALVIPSVAEGSGCFK